MKCNVTNCFKDAVTSHGVSTTTHGYCEEHRCCYKCGLKIKTDCKCKRPKERPEYISYLKEQNRYIPTTKDMWLGAKLLSQIAKATSHIFKRCVKSNNKELL